MRGVPAGFPRAPEMVAVGAGTSQSQFSERRLFRVGAVVCEAQLTWNTHRGCVSMQIKMEKPKSLMGKKP